MSVKKFTYKTVLDAVSFTFLSTLLNRAVVFGGFLSLPLLISTCYNKKKAPLFAVLFAISFLFSGSFNLILHSVVSGLFTAIIFSIYNAKNKKPTGELILYAIISCLPFILIPSSLEVKQTLILSGISVALTFIFIPVTKLLFVKRFTVKPEISEYVCLAVFVFLLEIGFARVFNINALKSVVIFIILLSGYVYKNSISAVAISVVFGIAPSIITGSFTYLSVYALMALASCVFIKNSRIISAFLLLSIDLIFMILLKAYGNFVTTDVFFSLVPIILFLFFPKSALEKARKNFLSFDEKHLSRYAVNRLRSSISNKLYGVSDVFNEMQLSFTRLKETVTENDELLSRMCDEIINNVCLNCPSCNRCKSKNLPDRTELCKILSVGVSKNRVSLIDLTKNFTENCGYTNGIICEMNALITKYTQKIKELEDLSDGKELIKLHAEGVAETLKGMAFETSKLLTFDTDTETKLYSALRKKGIIATEIMAYNVESEPEIDFVIERSVLSKSTFLKTVSEVLGKDMNVVSKTGISQTKCAVTLKASPNIDAVFGLAFCSKDGSQKSGDTHSLIKINEGKFLIALSDGMGSGIKAENTSATAISLIESFYKAGLDSNLILSIVNKVLALNTDDNFSAMDILSVDLFSLSADFIKIGAPQSYVLCNDYVKLIEGSSLPLGILDDLKPTGCKTDLALGSTVIMMTAGISDSFSSSTDFIDFLRTLQNNNPQVIADGILNRALELNGGRKIDDMTVLAVRIFKKAS